MIRHLVAWTSDKNLSGFYNRELEALPSDDDWCLFQDRDVWWPNPHFFKDIERVVQKQGDKFDLFTCMTNKVGTMYQVNRRMYKVDNIEDHVQCALNMSRAHGASVEDITNRPPISGMVILAKKSLITQGRKLKDGLLLGADNELHYIAKESNKRVGLMKGVYVWHYYRGNDINNKSHLL